MSVTRCFHPLLAACTAGLSLSALADPASAQHVEAPDVGMLFDAYQVSWPATFPTGEFTRMVTLQALPADLTFNYQPDLFLLRGGSLVRMPEAGMFDSFIDLGGPVHDLTVLEGGGLFAGSDGLVTVGAAGLRLWRVGSDNLAFSVGIDDTVTQADQVRCGDLNNDGVPDVVVRLQDTFTVYTGSGASWSVYGTWTANSGASVLDFDLVEFNGSGIDEFAIALTDGMEVHRVSWPGPVDNLLEQRRHPLFTENQVERCRDHIGPGHDAAVWLSRPSTLNRFAFAASSSLGPQPASLLPTGFDVVGMSMGTFDGSGGQDIALSLTDSSKVLTMDNLGSDPSGPAFDFNQANTETVTGLVGVNLGSYPAMHDLDGDGYAELMIGCTEANLVTFAYGEDPSSGAQPPPGSGASPDSTNPFEWAFVPGIGTGATDNDWLLEDLDEDDADIWDAIHGAVYINEPIPTQTTWDESLTATLWVDHPNDGLPFLQEAVAHCTDSEPSQFGTSSKYNVSLPVPSSNASAPDDFLVDGTLFVLEVKTNPVPSTNERPRTLRMGLGVVDGDSSAPAPESRLFTTSSLTVDNQYSTNLDYSRIPYVTSTSGVAEMPLLGLGIIVESVPLKRLKTPSGVPPRRPAVECAPEVSDNSPAAAQSSGT